MVKYLWKSSWTNLGEEVLEACLQVEDAVMDAERSSHAGDHLPEPLFEAVAFGQYVTRADNPERRGQTGILGSAAGLEILASSLRRDKWVEPVGGDTGKAARWRRQFLGTWLFIQSQLVPVKGEPAPQRDLVLRQAQVLRALVSAESSFTFAVLGAEATVPDGESEPPENDDAAEAPVEGLSPSKQVADSARRAEMDINPGPSAAEYSRAIESLNEIREWPPAKANRKLMKELLDELGKSRVDGLDLQFPGTMRPEIDSIPGYRFASTSPDLPTDVTHWAFHEAIVLVALVRCAWVIQLSEKEMADLWKAEDSALLYDYAIKAMRDGEDGEAQVGLYAAWALLQLEPRTSNSNPMAGDRLAFHHHEDPQRKRTEFGPLRNIGLREGEWTHLNKEARRTTRKLVSDKTRYADLVVPYFYKIERDDPPKKKKKKRKRRMTKKISYKQNHFVIPTIPILMSTAVHTDERFLLLPAFRDLLRSVLDALDQTPVGLVPGQGGGMNGTVNMCHLHEALCEVHDASMRIAARSKFWRLRALLGFRVSWLRRIARDNWKPVGIGVAVGIAGNVATMLILGTSG